MNRDLPSLPRCDNCRIEIPWRPVVADGKSYCCAGCAQGGPCSCSYDAPAIKPAEKRSRRRRSSKEIARRFFDEILAGKGDPQPERLVAPGAVIHMPEGQFAGPEGVRKLRGCLGRAIPDMRFELQDMIAEGDRVAARWVLRGTERGELFGVPPSGRPTTITGLSLFRIEDDRIVEHWMAEC